jgi:circadian clock protein KaiC
MQLRFFEAQGEVRQAISVIKTRTSRHERTIREFQINDHGLVLGEPLRDFRGVLSGVPKYAGPEQGLMPDTSAAKADADA